MTEREKLAPDQTLVLFGHLPGIERLIPPGRVPDESDIAKAEMELTRDDPRPLTSANVQRIAEACAWRRYQRRAGSVEIEGVKHVFRFYRGDVLRYRDEIGAMLAELPHQFRSSALGGGGGWSFLNGCGRHPYDEAHPNSELWTGLHMLVETLFCLGIVARKGRWLMGREYWRQMPGGMPYYEVTEL